VLKKVMKYKDFDGNDVEEEFYFHLSKVKLIKLEVSHKGGLEASLKAIIAAEDGETIVREFEGILHETVGKKSPDGRRHVQNAEISEAFFTSNAYDAFLMEMVENADAMAEFIRGVMPADMVAEASKAAAIIDARTPATDMPKQVPQAITRAQLMDMTDAELKDATEKIGSGEFVLIQAEDIT
jgi:hypothetical protein